MPTNGSKKQQLSEYVADKSAATPLTTPNKAERCVGVWVIWTICYQVLRNYPFVKSKPQQVALANEQARAQ